MDETREELDRTLARLEAVWDDIGLNEEQRKERRHHFNGHIVNLCEKIIDDETALKTRITNNIERNTQEILKLSEGLGVVPEDAVDGLTLLELDTLLQERVDHLLQLKEQRVDTLKLLQEKDEGICELLCETPYYVPAGLIPSLEDIKSVEDHVKTMETEKEEREKSFRTLKAGILKFLELLEQPPEDSFCQDIICSEDDDFPLGKAYLQQMRGVHSDLEFRVHECEVKSLELREKISWLWIALEIPLEEQQAFLSTAPKHTPSNIAKLEEELEKLRLLRLQNLSVFIEKLQEELATWWEKCYVGEEERKKFLDQQPDDASEEVLDAYENEVRKWKQHYEANKDIYILATQFMDLYNHMLELEERAKDPSRLFNTRGGALLLEEKAKKKVRTELPRVQESLLESGRIWAEQEGKSFHINGVPLEDYIRVLWENYDMKKEAEKTKRQVKGTQEVKRPGLNNPKTPAGLTTSKKRCREGEDTSSTKKMKPGVSLFKSPSKSTLRSPTKTPRTRPLTERNAQLCPPPVSSTDTSLHSTISYDKFEAGIDERCNEEIIHSSLMDDPSSEKSTPPEDQMRVRRLKETLNLASPHKAHARGKQAPLMSGCSPCKGTLRRVASQPSLHLKQGALARQGKPLFHKVFSNKAHPVHFLI
ncbi:protein regulator of cytokinesis 1-like [Penaeus monodon]|uniref:protein regulator of cytokinesis 1-like n=1 Tax=Penaeus monodon TaxID=6687 RepID=UPI0018A742B6|nr:protein regulator of cytokinesis 1-like [Penaeus monodon]